MSLCPCGSDRAFDDCCGPILSGAPAPTALALMRSRYTAYATGAWDHLGATLAPEMLPEFNRAEVENSAKGAVALGLDVRVLKDGGEEDETGSVEYVAKFKVSGQDYLHHELSHFRREAGRWVYVDGVVNPKQPPRQTGPKIGRNDPCPCGSGKKYKKCCGA
jgi:SEC-C motif-containing protein